MALIGIIRGFEEGFYATGNIIKLISALNKRFRSKINYIEIPLGDHAKHGYFLTNEALDIIRNCDCVYMGDIYSKGNPLNYTYETIAYALSNNIEYTCISGLGEFSHIDLNIASYFDGGNAMREGFQNTDGCSETRLCSTYSMMNIVKAVSRKCEKRRRMLVFIKDGECEYCANAFFNKFKDFTFPLSNFKLMQLTLKDICMEILLHPNQFDTIFASRSFSEMALGIYHAIMNDSFIFYNKYEAEKPTYVLRSLSGNLSSCNIIQSLCSYIAAFSDLLKYEFDMHNKAVALRLAMDEALSNTELSSCDTDRFIEKIIDELNKPVNKKYSKKTSQNRYIV